MSLHVDTGKFKLWAAKQWDEDPTYSDASLPEYLTYISHGEFVREADNLKEALGIVEVEHGTTTFVRYESSTFEFPDHDEVVYNMLIGKSPLSYNSQLISLISHIMNNTHLPFPVFIWNARCFIVRPEDLDADYLRCFRGLFIIVVT